MSVRDELGIEVSLAELALHHVDVNLGGKNMKQTQDGIATILNLEEEKYVEMLRKGEQVIKTMLSNVDKNANEIEDELLFSLNDSHGIAPEMAISLAHRSGWESMTLRTGFTAELAERHAKMAKDAAKEVNKSELVTGLENLPSTNSLYYDDVYQFEFDASVLFCGEIKGDRLALVAKRDVNKTQLMESLKELEEEQRGFFESGAKISLIEEKERTVASRIEELSKEMSKKNEVTSIVILLII